MHPLQREHDSTRVGSRVTGQAVGTYYHPNWGMGVPRSELTALGEPLASVVDVRAQDAGRLCNGCSDCRGVSLLLESGTMFYTIIPFDHAHIVLPRVPHFRQNTDSKMQFDLDSGIYVHDAISNLIFEPVTKYNLLPTGAVAVLPAVSMQSMLAHQLRVPLYPHLALAFPVADELMVRK